MGNTPATISLARKHDTGESCRDKGECAYMQGEERRLRVALWTERVCVMRVCVMPSLTRRQQTMRFVTAAVAFLLLTQHA